MKKINQSIILLSILAGALIVLALVITGGMGTYQPDQSAQAQMVDANARRQVQVAGVGEVKAQPDTAQIRIGVETDSETAQDAMEENNIRATQVISELKSLGIESKDIQTSNFSIRSTYDDDNRSITGYRVGNVVTVTIRNLEQAGELLDKVVQVGANQIYGISFTVDDPTELIEQARERAMDDAKSKAQQLAKLGGASLGDVLLISENTRVTEVFREVNMGLSTESQAQAPAVPIEAGEQTFGLNVQVIYEIQ
jgi:hypothetical protein